MSNASTRGDAGLGVGTSGPFLLAVLAAIISNLASHGQLHGSPASLRFPRFSEPVDTGIRVPSVVAAPPLRAPLPPARDKDHTLHGLGGPTPQRGAEEADERERDSGLIAADGYFQRYEAEHRRAERLAAELAKTKDTPPPVPQPAIQGPTLDQVEKAARSSALHALLLKVGGGLAPVTKVIWGLSCVCRSVCQFGLEHCRR